MELLAARRSGARIPCGTAPEAARGVLEPRTRPRSRRWSLLPGQRKAHLTGPGPPHETRPRAGGLRLSRPDQDLDAVEDAVQAEPVLFLLVEAGRVVADTARTRPAGAAGDRPARRRPRAAGPRRSRPGRPPARPPPAAAARAARAASCAIRASLSVYELIRPMTRSLSASSRPVSSIASSPRSTNVSELGAIGGAAIGIWVIHGCWSIISRWTMAHIRNRVPPAVPGQHEVLGALRAGVPHQLEQFLLAGDVPVQRHRGEPELLGDARHGDRLKALGVGEPHRRRHDCVDRQAGLRAALRPAAPPPEQVQARGQRRGRRRWTSHLGPALSDMAPPSSRHLTGRPRAHGGGAIRRLTPTVYDAYSPVYDIHS